MKTLFLPVAASAIVCCNLTLSSAQQQTGPATLENILKSAEAHTSSSAPETNATAASPKRPAGTVSRPEDGVKHPDLDKAWAEYDAVVAEAAESIKAAISKQFDAATAKGDLDNAEKWQTALEKFESTGEVPSESEMKAAVSAAVVDYKKAKNELSKAYEAVVKALTMNKKISDAKAVRDERKTFEQPSLPKPQSHNSVIPKAKGFKWSSTFKGWTGVINANNQFGIQIPKPVAGMCRVRFLLAGASSSNTNGRVVLTTPEGQETLITTWSHADSIPVSGDREPSHVSRSIAGRRVGKEFSIPVGSVNLQPGNYMLSFRYESGDSAAVIEAVEFVVE